MSWTEERIELLQKLWLEGMSASRIASELANGLTRNAVIGKVYRLGLSGRTKATATVEPSPRPRHKSAQRPSSPPPAVAIVQGNTALALTPVEIEAPAPVPIKDVVISMTEPVTIVDLREAMCRWPIGDPTLPEFRFCGAARIPGAGPYCAHHAGIAYQPHQDRRRERRLQQS
jgi:GcrA cell cycle regulator